MHDDHDHDGPDGHEHEHQSHEHGHSGHEHDHHGHEHDHDGPEHEHGHHGHEHHEHGHHHGDGDGERSGFTGKVNGLIYDRRGDFDGFLLDTDDGEHAFDAREPEIERVVDRAWTERIVTTVFVDAHEPWRPARIVLRA